MSYAETIYTSNIKMVGKVLGCFSYADEALIMVADSASSTVPFNR